MGDSIEALLEKEMKLQALVEKTKQEAEKRVAEMRRQREEWLNREKKKVEEKFRGMLERDRKDAMKTAEELLAQGRTTAEQLRGKLANKIDDAVKTAVDLILEREM